MQKTNICLSAYRRYFCILHLPEVNRKTLNENSQQILENIEYDLDMAWKWKFK